MELFRLFGSILIEDKDAINTLKKVDKQGKETGGGLDKIVEKGVKVGAAIYAGATTAISGMLKLADSTADTADKWDKLSLRTGIGVENLQRWGYAADQSGADIGKLEVGMKKMSDVMDSAINGNKSAQESYARLGISMKELSSMTPEQAFERTMKALGDMEGGAARNAIGNDILGKSYTELLPLISEGSEGMEALKNRADELGIVMSADAVSAGVVFGDTMSDVKNSLGAAKDKIMLELLPKLTEMLNWVITHMPEIQSVAGGALNFISGAIQLVIDNSNWLIPVLTGLTAIFLGLKIIGIVNALIVAYTTFTQGATLAQAIFNAVMAANPIMLIVIAIGVLIAAIVALWMNWDKVSAFLTKCWQGIKDTAVKVFNSIVDFFKKWGPTILIVLSGPIGWVVALIVKNWDKIKNTTVNVFTSIKNFLSGIFSSIGNFFKGMVNGVIKGLNVLIGGLNKLNFDVPDWVPLLGGKKFGFDIPKIPMLAKGTDYFKGGLAIVGEMGPELVRMPRGAQVKNNKETKDMLGGFTINIENFVNNRKQDVQAFAEELEFYRQQAAISKG